MAKHTEQLLNMITWLVTAVQIVTLVAAQVCKYCNLLYYF